MPQRDDDDGERPSVAGGNEVSAAGYCYALLWVLLLLVVAWPLALICAVLWVLIQPCEACIGEGAEDANRCLYPFLRYPRRVGRAIHRCDTDMPKPVPKPDNAGKSGGGRGGGQSPDEENGY